MRECKVLTGVPIAVGPARARRDAAPVAFLRDDAGGVSPDFVTASALAIALTFAMVAIVIGGVETMSDEIAERQRQTVIRTTFAETGPITEPTDPELEPDPGTDLAARPGGGGPVRTRGAVGNPGNDKAVGRAGEAPNGRAGWGSGSRGRSDR